jgi:hypothetical protein
MGCNKPLQATFNKESRSFKFSKAKAQLFHTHGYTTKQLKCIDSEYNPVPCGQCMGCRIAYARSWAVRIVHEAEMHDQNSYITLTYSNNKLPKNGSLKKKDYQDFLKRYRKWLGEKKIRYFVAGEYGEKLSRPHYHFIIFGHEFEDKKVFRKGKRYTEYVSATLAKLWPHGFHTIGTVTPDSAGYVAKYVTKKIKGEEAENHYKGKLPEFAEMSRANGIGKSWLQKYHGDVYPSDFVLLNGERVKKFRTPRYYDKKYEEMFPDKMLMIKQNREKKLTNVEVDKKSLQAKEINLKKLQTKRGYETQ